MSATRLTSAPIPSAAARPIVRNLLSRSPAFIALPPEKRRSIAHNTARVAAFLIDPHGLMKREFKAPLLAGVVAGVVTGVLAGAVTGVVAGVAARDAKKKNVPRDSAAQTPNLRFVQMSSAAMDNLVQAVNFPTFVNDLINGVFGAIVDASIQQMEAYAALISAVAKSVDEFVAHTISPACARCALTASFPDLFRADRVGPPAKPLAAVDCRRVAEAIGLRAPLGDLRVAAERRRLVEATRRRLARNRQQLLATQVMMGINRIVVTDGKT